MLIRGRLMDFKMKNIDIFESSGALGSAISNGSTDSSFATIQIMSSLRLRDFILTLADNCAYFGLIHEEVKKRPNYVIDNWHEQFQ